MVSQRPFAIVTGASSGIGLELARLAARDGHDLLIAADRALDEAASELRAEGVAVETVEADLARSEGVDALLAATGDRPVDLLFANAGHGARGGFADQDWDEARHVLDTNVTGTIHLIHRVVRPMRERGAGRILITGSIAGYAPGGFSAVYNASKAFIDSFAEALRAEVADEGITVTNLMPGGTETEFFHRAGLDDTKIGQSKKDDPVWVARVGYDAMMQGRDQVVPGLKNKLVSTLENITPAALAAKQHGKAAKPGSAEERGSSKARPLLFVAGLVAAAVVAGAAARERSAPRRRTSATRAGSSH